MTMTTHKIISTKKTTTSGLQLNIRVAIKYRFRLKFLISVLHLCGEEVTKIWVTVTLQFTSESKETEIVFIKLILKRFYQIMVGEGWFLVSQHNHFNWWSVFYKFKKLNFLIYSFLACFIATVARKY